MEYNSRCGKIRIKSDKREDVALPAEIQDSTTWIDNWGSGLGQMGRLGFYSRTN